MNVIQVGKNILISVCAKSLIKQGWL